MEDVDLIAEVEMYKVLYAPKHAFYKDNTKKGAIAAVLQATGEYLVMEIHCFYVIAASLCSSRTVVYRSVAMNPRKNG